MDELNFDLAVKEVAATIGGKKYTLREASEDAAIKYKNALARSVRVADGKVVGSDGVGDAQALLVSLCLFETIADDAGRPAGERNVPLVTVRGWPARVVRPLFHRAEQISGLEDGPKDPPARIAALRAELASLEKQQAEGERAKN